MVELNISWRLGKLGLEITNARYDLKQQRGEFEMTQTPAEFDLEITAPELSVDYRPMLESLGIGDVEFRSKTFSDEVKQDYLENLEKYVQLGQRFAAIEKGDSIGNIVFEYLKPQELDINIVPIAPVDVKCTLGRIDTNVKLGKIETNFNFGRITIENFVYPSVRVFLEEEPYLKIEPVGQTMDIKK